MPKRIQFSRPGGAEVLEYQDFTPAPLAAGEVRVKNHAIGLNFVDIYYRSGLYPVPALPSGLGNEGAGVVAEVGSAACAFKVGERVAYATAPLGAYAQEHNVPAERLVKLPDDIHFEQAAAVMLKGLTVQYLLRQTYAVQPGQCVLWHAAAGGVGLLACQWAKALGVRLIGTVSSKEKAERAKAAGAWQVIDYSREDVAARVLELTQGAKCPVVYDSVGKDTFATSLDCLAPRGLLVSFGNASGAVDGVNLGLLAQKGSVYVTRPTLSHYADTAQKLRGMADELFALLQSGKISASIGARFALAEAAKAQQALASRQTLGSTLLLP